MDTLNDRNEWTPSTVERERATAAAQAARQQRDDREGLLFEKAWPRFLADLEGDDEYADQRGAHRAFERLERFWRGFYIDQITSGDVRRFYTERMNAGGAYGTGCRKVSIRTPEFEMSYVAALYKRMQEHYPALPRRPWSLRPASGKKGSAFAPYKRQHEWQVPDDERDCHRIIKSCNKCVRRI